MKITISNARSYVKVLFKFSRIFYFYLFAWAHARFAPVIHERPHAHPQAHPSPRRLLFLNHTVELSRK